jgi:hypothetical protein
MHSMTRNMNVRSRTKPERYATGCLSRRDRSDHLCKNRNMTKTLGSDGRSITPEFPRDLARCLLLRITENVIGQWN